MRVCPKCGYVDPPYWKHCRWSYYIDSCSFENFKILHPNLANQLLKTPLVEDDNYIYRTCKIRKAEKLPRWVQRKAKIDVTIGWQDLCERFPHLKNKTSFKKLQLPTSHHVPADFARIWSQFHPNQKKLFEENEKMVKE